MIRAQEALPHLANAMVYHQNGPHTGSDNDDQARVVGILYGIVDCPTVPSAHSRAVKKVAIPRAALCRAADSILSINVIGLTVIVRGLQNVQGPAWCYFVICIQYTTFRPLFSV